MNKCPMVYVIKYTCCPVAGLWGVLIWQESFSQAVWFQSSWSLLSNPGTACQRVVSTRWCKRRNYSRCTREISISHNSLPRYFCPHSGSHSAPQLVFHSQQRRPVWSEEHFSDWPLPGGRGGCPSRRFEIDRRVLVSALTFPPGRTHHYHRAVRAPGPNQLGEGGCKSWQPSPSRPGGWAGMQYGQWHQNRNGGGRLKGAADVRVVGVMNRAGVLICKLIL